MKKKVSLILCLVVMVLTMAACGTDPASVDYFGMKYEDMQLYMSQQVDTLSGLSEEDAASIELYGDEMTKKLVSTWNASVEGLGESQGLGEFTATKTQKNVTIEQKVKFSGREVVLSYVYTYNYETKTAELTDASVDLVYTLGEKMEKAGLNTLMGMGTVFIVLILISVIIYCFKLIPYLQKRLAGGDAAPEAPAPAPAAVSAAPVPAGDELELAAVISAAIAASAGVSEDSFVVRSIHRR